MVPLNQPLTQYLPLSVPTQDDLPAICLSTLQAWSSLALEEQHRLDSMHMQQEITEGDQKKKYLNLPNCKFEKKRKKKRKEIL